MASGLKAKLNAMSSAAPKAKKRETGRGLVCRVSREVADERLYDLSGAALRRIGWSGRKFDVEKCLFLDTETTGLSGGAGTVAFLVGLGRIEGREFVVRQFLMPTYAAEPQLLTRVNEFSEGCDTVVTFNGKSFDVPLLASRCIMNRTDNPFAGMRHLDLIHPARRTWKLRLKDCSLGNLEEKVLNLKARMESGEL